MTIIKVWPEDPFEVLPVAELAPGAPVAETADVTVSDALGTIALTS